MDPKMDTSRVDLQATLVDLIDLTLQSKQAHWNVVGPNFRALHLQLDEMILEYRNWADEVAERIRALEGLPDGRPKTVADDAPESVTTAELIADREVVNKFVDRLVASSKSLGERIARIGDADPVSQDLLIEIQGGIDKQRWMLKSHQV